MNKPARSYLFAPGYNVSLMMKALAAAADCVVFDLEDGVPASLKAEARTKVSDVLGTLPSSVPSGSPPARLWVRINPPGTDQWRADLDAIMAPCLAGLRVPKAEDPDELRDVSEQLSELEREHDLPVGHVRLTCTIETAAGLQSAPAIAALDRVDLLAFGAADFVADIGAFTKDSGIATLWARAQLVVIARAAGIAPPIAPPYTNLNDLEGLGRSSMEARELGFFGQTVLHPRQLATVHRAFTPDAAELRWAREILAAYETAVAKGQGSAVLPDGQFVGPPVVTRARNLLARARDEPDSPQERDA